MLIRFYSPAGGEVLMMGEVARAMLTAMDHDTQSTTTGSITETQLPAAIARLQAAMTGNESAPAENHKNSDGEEKKPISFRQRAHPLLELLQASLQGKEPVIWRVVN